MTSNANTTKEMTTNDKTQELAQSLDTFIANWISHQKTENRSLEIEQDDDWPSPAILRDNADGQMSVWQPVLQSANNNLDSLRDGLELAIDPQLEAYFTRYWSDNLNAVTDRGGLQLLFPWNQDDFVRLQENLIAHVLMKRRLRQRDTLFFAVTDEEDYVLSVINDTGEVALERVGKEPQDILAPDLTRFLQNIKPGDY